MRPYLFDYNVPSELTLTGNTNTYLLIKATLITEYDDGSLGVLCEVIEASVTTLLHILSMNQVAKQIEEIAVAHFEQEIIHEQIRKIK